MSFLKTYLFQNINQSQFRNFFLVLSDCVIMEMCHHINVKLKSYYYYYYYAYCEQT